MNNQSKPMYCRRCQSHGPQDPKDFNFDWITCFKCAAAPQPPALTECGACGGCEGACRLDADSPPALGGELVSLIIRDLCETVPAFGTDAVHLRVSDLEAILQTHLAPLQAENRRLRQFETALSEWADKTEWLRITIQPKELGMHLADVMRARFDQLKRAEKNDAIAYKAVIERQEELRAERDQLKALSVTNILMDVVPGDGSGHEVYAKSVKEVVKALSSQYYALENVADERDQLQTRCDELEGVVRESSDYLDKATNSIWHKSRLHNAMKSALPKPAGSEPSVEPPEATQDCHDDDLGDGEAERMQRKATNESTAYDGFDNGVD